MPLQNEALRVGAKFRTLDTVLSPAQQLFNTHHTTTPTKIPTTTHTTTTHSTSLHTTTSAPPQDIDLLSQDLAAAALALLQQRGGVFEAVPRGVVGSALLRQALKVSVCVFDGFFIGFEVTVDEGASLFICTTIL